MRLPRALASSDATAAAASAPSRDLRGVLALARSEGMRTALRANSPRFTLLLLAVMLALDYGDRTLVGAMGPAIKSTFHIDNTALGLLVAAGNLVAALAAVPVGMLTDRVPRMRLLAISIVLWTTATMVVGAAASFAMLFLSRLVLGAVAAASGPTVPSLVGDLVPSGDRSAALGFVDSGQLVGTGIGFALGGIVTAFLSFRWGFWLLGTGSILLAGAFWLQPEPPRTDAAGPTNRTNERQDDDCSTIEEVVRQHGIEPAESAMVRQDPMSYSMWDVAWYVIRVRTDAIVTIARSIGDYFLAAVGAFAVVFASQQYGVSPQMADLGIVSLGIGALAGVLVLGRLGDVLLRRGQPNGRILLGAVGYLVGPFFLLPALLTHSLVIALPLISGGAFFLAGSGPVLDAVRVDVLVPRLRGRAEAIRGVLRTTAEAAAPLLFAILAANLAAGNAGLQLAFLVTLPALLLSGLILLLGLRTYEPDVAAALASAEGGS